MRYGGDTRPWLFQASLPRWMLLSPRQWRRRVVGASTKLREVREYFFRPLDLNLTSTSIVLEHIGTSHKELSCSPLSNWSRLLSSE